MSATEFELHMTGGQSASPSSTASLPPSLSAGLAPATAIDRAARRPAGPGRSLMSRIYVAAWGLAAVAAAAYLTALVFKPELLNTWMPQQLQTQPESNLGQRATAKAMAEVKPLQDKLTARDKEVARLKSELARRSADYAALRSEFDDIANPSDTTSAAASPPEQTPPAPAPNAARDVAEAAPIPATPVAQPPRSTNFGADASVGIPGLSVVGVGTNSGAPTPPSFGTIATPARIDAAAAADVGAPPGRLKLLNAPLPPNIAPNGGSNVVTGSVAKSAADAGRVVLPPLPSQRGTIPAAALRRPATPARTSASETAGQALGASQQTARLAPVATRNTGFVTTTETTSGSIGAAALPNPTVGAFATSAVPAAGTLANGTTSSAAAGVGAGSAGVRLARGASLDALRLSWSLLTENHAQTLGGLQPRYLTGFGGNGPSYELVAGPLRDAGAAEAVCGTMRSRGVPCITGTYGGNALF